MMLAEVIAANVTARAYGGLAQPLPRAHRALQQLAEACTYAWLLSPATPSSVSELVEGPKPIPVAELVEGPTAPPEGGSGSPLLDQAAACLAALAAQQGRDGLFQTGDNVESPPDSSFTANGLARLVRVCRGRDSVQHLAEAALTVLARLAPGLLAGGVHTPNHRWELASALAQVGDLLGDDRCSQLADEWLAEGIDLQEDGLYSERSPNYAAFVTNPCLLTLADLRNRPDLVDIVHANLHVHQLLTDRTGRVETLQSRRQDQKLDDFSAEHFAWQYRVLAHRVGCGECGAAALALEARSEARPDADAARRGDDRATTVSPGTSIPLDSLEPAAEALMTPDVLGDLPVRPRQPRTGWTVLETSQLAIHRSDQARLVVRAAPDVAALGRVTSGAAANPTLAHVRVGPAAGQLDAGWAGTWLSSVRLSRSFFGLGPFRADEMLLDRGRVVLRETKAAAYYHPMTVHPRFEFEGRFAAEMGFEARRQDLVTLETEVTVSPQPDGVELTVRATGPVVPHHLELGFADLGLAVTGALPLGEDQYVATGPVILSAPGIAQVRITLDSVGEPYLAKPYDPGEAYTYLGGTDAVGGLRVYVPFLSPGEFRVRVTIGEPALF